MEKCRRKYLEKKKKSYGTEIFTLSLSNILLDGIDGGQWLE